MVVQSTCGNKCKGTLLTPSSSPPHFSHLRLSNLRGAWVTVPNLGMVAPCSCFISFSEGCCESGPQSKFYQEVSATFCMPLHVQAMDLALILCASMCVSVCAQFVRLFQESRCWAALLAGLWTLRNQYMQVSSNA